MDRLSQALGSRREEIEESLMAARKELKELRTRERELASLVAEAEAALGQDAASKNLTLHDAIAVVLSANNNQWMTTKEISDEVNRRRLYSKRDGSSVESNQIHARTKNYERMFEKDRQNIRLRTDESPEPQPHRQLRSKYDPLRDWLGNSDDRNPKLTFDEIEEMVGRLPPSARKHQAWWANNPSSHVQARAWETAGYRVEGFDQTREWVRFTRVARLEGPDPQPSDPQSRADQMEG